MSVSLAGRSPAFEAVAVLVVALAVACLVAAAPLARPAPADTTIPVTTTNDENNADGDCSLREAVIAANLDAVRDACPAGSGADVVTVPAGTYALTIPEATPYNATVGDLDITGPTTIKGDGARTTSVAGGATFNDRIFHNGATTTISGLTITGGKLADGGLGGGVLIPTR